jgi:8-oxo-dGTP pyrophosphatase MutT (NUDIX family)
VRRELSAGGVVVRRMRGADWLAAIRPSGRPPGFWALPKGLVDPGERALEAAVREVLEETGLRAEPVAALEPTRYVYQRGGERISKVVRFWLMRRVGGRLGAIAPEQRREVAEARWLPLAGAERLLAHRGERALVAEARALLRTGDPLESGAPTATP